VESPTQYRPSAKLDYEIEKLRAERSALEEAKRAIQRHPNYQRQSSEQSNSSQALVEAAQAELARRQKDPKWQEILPVAVGGKPVAQPEPSPAVTRAASAAPIPTPVYQMPYVPHPYVHHAHPQMYSMRHPSGTAMPSMRHPSATAIPSWYGSHNSPIEHAADVYRGHYTGSHYSTAGMQNGSEYSYY